MVTLPKQLSATYVVNIEEIGTLIALRRSGGTNPIKFVYKTSHLKIQACFNTQTKVKFNSEQKASIPGLIERRAYL